MQFDNRTTAYLPYFVDEMTKKLDANNHKGDRGNWLKDDPNLLYNSLTKELFELSTAMDTGDAEKILSEAADVANFAMMIADWYKQHTSMKEIE